MPENPTVLYLMGSAVAALFGLLVKVIAEILKRADLAVADANKRTDTANATVQQERERYDKLLEKVVTVTERLDDNVDGLFRILDGHLRYIRENSDIPVPEPPPPKPPSTRPRRASTGGAP